VVTSVGIHFSFLPVSGPTRLSPVVCSQKLSVPWSQKKTEERYR